jgi:hypothetical protein
VTCVFFAAGVDSIAPASVVRDDSTGGRVDPMHVVVSGVIDALDSRGVDTAGPMVEELLEDADADPLVLSHTDENPSDLVLQTYPRLGDFLDRLTKPPGSRRLAERLGIADDVEDADAMVRVRVV